MSCQTAERIRAKHPELEWFQFVGLIHDLGKVRRDLLVCGGYGGTRALGGAQRDLPSRLLLRPDRSQDLIMHIRQKARVASLGKASTPVESTVLKMS